MVDKAGVSLALTNQPIVKGYFLRCNNDLEKHKLFFFGIGGAHEQRLSGHLYFSLQQHLEKGI